MKNLTDFPSDLIQSHFDIKEPRTSRDTSIVITKIPDSLGIPLYTKPQAPSDKFSPAKQVLPGWGKSYLGPGD